MNYPTNQLITNQLDSPPSLSKQKSVATVKTFEVFVYMQTWVIFYKCKEIIWKNAKMALRKPRKGI